MDRQAQRSAAAALGRMVKRWRPDLSRMGPPYTVATVAALTGLAGVELASLTEWAARKLGAPTEAAARPPDLEPRVTVQHDGTELEVEVDDRGLPHLSARGRGVVRNLDELLAQAEIDPAVWTDNGTFKINTWSTAIKLADTDAQTGARRERIVPVRSWQVSARLFRRHGSLGSRTAWAEPIGRAAAAAAARECKLALFVPDMHLGYRWAERHQRLVPIHDWAALDLMLQAVELLQPDELVFLGDGFDFAQFSTRWPVKLGLRHTTEPALRTGHAIVRHCRQLTPGAAIKWTGGNHDNRTERDMVGTEYDGLTAVGDELPALAFARLAGLDRLDVEWAEYDRALWLWPGTPGEIKVHHGTKVKSKPGGTVGAVAETARYNEVFGHIHRAEMAHRTLHDRGGYRTITVMSPGTLARLDGEVPGSAEPDWQHALGWARHTDGQTFLGLYPIDHGRMVIGSRVLTGDGHRLAAHVAEQVGYPQLAIP